MNEHGTAPTAADAPPIRHGISFAEALPVWIKIALLSFGGPTGQIAVMHRILVDEKRWVGEARFLHALNYCMLLPGPEAQQLVTYIGWLLHRAWGGLVAGTLFVLPGYLAILALSIVYARFHDLSVVDGLFFGLKPAVLAIVVQAVLRIGGRALKTRAMVAIAVAAFIGIFFLSVPFPAIVLAAGLIGYVGHKTSPALFTPMGGHGGAKASAGPPPALPDDAPDPVRPSVGRAVRVVVFGLLLWFGPVALIALMFGSDHILVTQGLFFSKLAVVTFGGAYAVLAYVAQQAVEMYHWVQPTEMLDGLGMAETTPGPLIMVLEFVGFMGAYRNPAPLSPMTAGLVAATLTTWVTFVPCFVWIFLGAPYVERLRGNKALSAALSAITAAVVGVVLNLAVWFAIHVVFARVGEAGALGVTVPVPDLASLSPWSLALTVLALVAVFRWKLGMVKTLAGAGALGIAIRMLG